MVSSGSTQPTDFWIFTPSSSSSSVGSVFDASGSTYSSPLLDASQDLVLESPYTFDSSTGMLKFEFSRPLVTNDGSNDRDITLTSNTALLWAFNPNAGSFNYSYALTPNAPLKMLQHPPDSRGSIPQWNWTTSDSDCVARSSSCPSLHSHGGASSSSSASAALLRSRCYGNGWPSAELAGDRDGGAATPTLYQQQQASLSSSRSCLSSPNGIFKASWWLTASSSTSAKTSTTPSSLITFTLTSKAGGWLAIGFNPQVPGMSGADIVYAWVTSSSSLSSCVGLLECNVVIVDAFSNGHSIPSPDISLGGKNDITLVNASLSSTGTVSVTFTRTLSGSGNSDVDLSLMSAYVIWAYGTAPGDPSSLSISQHIGMGSSSSVVSIPETANTCMTSSISTVASNTQKKGGLFAIHAALMTFAFWVCFTIAAASARWQQVFEEENERSGDRKATENSELPVGDNTNDISSKSVQTSVASSTNVPVSSIISSNSPNTINPDDVQFESGANALSRHRRRVSLPSLPESNSSSSSSQGPKPGNTPSSLPSLPSLLHSTPPLARWFRIHLFCNALGVALAIIGLISIELALRRGQPSSVALAAREWGSHQRCGATALAAILLQVLLGVFRPPHGPGLMRSRWLIAHRLVASLSLISAIVAIPLGLQRSAILSTPAIYVVGVHGILAVSYLLFIELRLIVLVYEYVCIPVYSFIFAKNVLTTTFSLCSRRTSFCFYALSSLLLASVLTVWVLLQTAVPIGIWGGSSWVAPLSQRIIYPPNGDADLCFSMTNLTVPSSETSYMCRAFAFPPDVALHATNFLPIVDRSDVVHHMILYSVDRDYTMLNNIECSSMPAGTQGPVYVWAVGAKEFSLPNIVGLPVASNLGTTKGVAYGVLQVHYSNPAKIKNIIDSSGVMIKTTSELRPVSGGLVMLGTNVGSIRIPQNRASYGLAGTCSASSTRNLPSAKTLNPLTNDYVVLASAMHAHTLGRRIWTEQWRGSTRVRAPDGSDPLGTQPFYSFSNQQFVDLPSNSLLKPGDELITRCVYENTISAGKKDGNTVASAGKAVVGCEATTCEMCFNFLFIYPMIPANGCTSNAVPFCEDTGTDGTTTSTTLPSCSKFK